MSSMFASVFKRVNFLLGNKLTRKEMGNTLGAKSELENIIETAVQKGEKRIVYESDTNMDVELERLCTKFERIHNVELFWKHSWIKVPPTYPFLTDIYGKFIQKYKSLYKIRILFADDHYQTEDSSSITSSNKTSEMTDVDLDELINVRKE